MNPKPKKSHTRLRDHVVHYNIICYRRSFHKCALRQLAKELEEGLERKADILQKLEKNGWKQSGGLYSLSFFKDDISKEQAEKELRQLGILDEIDLKVIRW